MDREVDKLFAEKLGYYEVEETDFGAVIGREPDTGKLCIVPSPTSDIRDFYRLFEYFIREYAPVEIGFNGDYHIRINGEIYKDSSFKSCVIEAFNGVNKVEEEEGV